MILHLTFASMTETELKLKSDVKPHTQMRNTHMQRHPLIFRQVE